MPGCRMLLALTLVPCGMLFALSTWFLTNAVASGLEQATGISSATVLQLTNAVQAGFILATVGMAATGLADRFPAHLLFGASAVCAGFINALVLVDGLSLGSLAVVRLLTGAFLAGVYPIGMKLLFSAAPNNRGLALGLAVGALTMGSGLPHLLAANFADNWRAVVATSSALSAGAGLGVAVLVTLTGGELGEAPAASGGKAPPEQRRSAASGAALPAKSSHAVVEWDVGAAAAAKSAAIAAGSALESKAAVPAGGEVELASKLSGAEDAAPLVPSPPPPRLAAEPAGGGAKGPDVPLETAAPEALAVALTRSGRTHAAATLARSADAPAGGEASALGSALLLWTHVPSRLAFIGYLGHVAELYAAWTVFAPFLRERFTQGLDPADEAGLAEARARASVVTFAAFAAGAVLCPVAGLVADFRLGRSLTTAALMVLSGSTALWLGFVTDAGLAAFGVVFYGATIVPDSAQFSTAIGELAPPKQRGAMLSASTGCGFLVTMVTIATTTAIQQAAGWGVAFALLAIGPAIGAVSMLMLRARPEAVAMADGRR